MIASCDFCGCDGHDCTSDMAVSSARDVASCGFDGDCLLASDESWDDFDFDVFKCAALDLSESSDIVMSELDILLEFFRHEVFGVLDFVFSESDIAVVLVEFFGIFESGFIAAVFDLVEDIENGFLDVG